MKIAQVALRFDAPGGVETNVREVSRRLLAAGEEVEIFASDLYDEASWDRRSGYAPVVDGVPVHRFAVRKRLIPRLTLPLMIGLMDALSERRPQVIHAHSHRYGHVLEAALVADRRNIPLVVSTHYHPADRRERPWTRGLLRMQDVGFGATAYRIARALIVETELEARLVRAFAPADRIRVIPPGIDLAAWSDPVGDIPPPGLPDEYLLFFGRVAPNKGLPFLVEALARLPPAARLPLVVMGPDWGERTALEAQARSLGLEGSVRFLGHVSPDGAVRAVIRGARALVLPSEWEAFGLVLLMAMAAGTPIVATGVGGVPEVLDHGRAGLLVPYADPVALADALGRLTDEPGPTHERVRVARERVQAFDWSVTVERHRALYREVASG
ncbi:MAG: glycosyltransferase family 4 protein [Thermoplasmata archaeon]|nr:glycosyltransferase family 4 protein [Thermoplasmata archaeon]